MGKNGARIAEMYGMYRCAGAEGNKDFRNKSLAAPAHDMYLISTIALERY